LFQRYGSTFNVRSYDIAPDGRFLIIKKADPAALQEVVEYYFPTRIRAIHNWFESS